MAEETQATQIDAKDQGLAAASAETIKPDTESPEPTIPKHRFDEVSAALKKLQSEAAANAKAAAKADEERMASQNEWKQLAETRQATIDELTALAEMASKFNEREAARYEAEMASLPEEIKAMAPDDDADVLTKIDWLEKAKRASALATDQQVTPGLRFPAQHPGGPTPPLTTKSVAENVLKKAYAPRK